MNKVSIVSTYLLERINKIIVLAIFILITLVGCDKLEEGLPEPTQTGSGIFGVLINGKIWKPRSTASIIGPPAVTIKYSTKYHLLVINAINTDKKNSIALYAEKIESVGYYNFSYRDNVLAKIHNGSGCMDSTRFQDGACSNSYMLKDSVTSLLQITRLDTSMQIVSGTFTLKLVKPDGTSKSLTEGRFDDFYNLY
ncbi:MAG: hypothetical protein HOO91_06800 [Bacteroidales bacterium]|nr:hypothetical protein [Bacteroidales bacterium]